MRHLKVTTLAPKRQGLPNPDLKFKVALKLHKTLKQVFLYALLQNILE